MLLVLHWRAGEADGYILGSTSKGYDIWYGIIWGSRTSLDVALKVVISGTFIAVVAGGDFGLLRRARR